MTPRARMTEREKVYGIALLIPLLWPFIPILILCDIGEAIRDKWFEWRHRRRIRSDEPGVGR